MIVRVSAMMAIIPAMLLTGCGAIDEHSSPGHRASITIEGDTRHIQGDGLPAHQTGEFPNRGNPHTIREQSHDFRIPLEPKLTGRTIELGRHPFGIALNGVTFEPGTAGFWNRDPNSGWRLEALGERHRLGLDDNNAHVQPNGAYHYHGVPTGLLNRLLSVKKNKQPNQPVLLGYAADGFPIYGPQGYRDPKNSDSGLKNLAPGYQLRQGTRSGGPGGSHDGRYVQDYVYVPGLGDLDDCNGRVAVTPEYPKGIYHYVITDAFPGPPRCFKGTPDESFTSIAERRRHRTGPGPNRGRRERRQRPRY
jgi:hypothetical protein